eukprot:COSAG01_NODE_832_length_13250_cov_23.422828_5_plen_105_part_00
MRITDSAHSAVLYPPSCARVTAVPASVTCTCSGFHAVNFKAGPLVMGWTAAAPACSSSNVGTANACPPNGLITGNTATNCEHGLVRWWVVEMMGSHKRGGVGNI